MIFNATRSTATLVLGALLTACTLTAPEPASSPQLISMIPYHTPTSPCSEIDVAYQETMQSGSSSQIENLEAARRQCRLDPTDLNRNDAEALLMDSDLALKVSAPTILTLYARSDEDAPRLCCSIQGANVWTPIDGTNLWGAQFRLKDLNRMMLYLTLPGNTDGNLEYRGPNAPAKPVFYGLNVQNLAGQTIESELFSPQLGETRKLKVYLPPGHAPEQDWPVLFFADGISVDYTARLIEPMIVAGDMAPVVIVGLLSGQRGIVEDRSDVPVALDLRNADYLPDLDDEAPHRFGQHMAFVSETVIPWAEKSFGAGRNGQRRGVTGKSSGGTFALYAAYMNPDLFDVALPQSPGSGTLFDANPAPSDAPEFWLSGGTLEVPFLNSAEASAEALQTAGYKVHFKTYFAGHAPDQWNQALADTLPKAFPPAH